LPISLTSRARYLTVLGAGKIAGGIVCLVLGIIIFATSLYFYNVQTDNVEYCNSFLGGLQGSLDPEAAQACSNAGAFQAGALGGILLGGALAIIGLILAIVGAVQQGKKRKVVSKEPVQTSISSPQQEISSQQEIHTSPNNMNTIYCRYCGELRPRRDESCSLCGRSSITSSTGMKQCTVCNASMSEDSIYCASCGAKFQQPSNISLIGNIQEEANMPSSPLLTYEDTKKGIKIQYPSDWNKEVEYNRVTFSVLGEKYVSGLWVETDRIRKNSVEDFIQERIEDIRKQSRDIKFLESSNRANLSGKPAYKLVYIRRAIDASSLVKRLEIGTIVDRKLYVLNGGSRTKNYTEILPTLERMISSFELTPNKAFSGQ
jgi:hypothetical protein